MFGNVVSVIVPIYNVEQYLDKCVESIVNQSYKYLEIILVDDGSPDNCPQICEEWAKKDNRIKVIHKSNGGLSFARNVGLEAATGEYVMFIDSDDWVDCNTVEELLNLVDQETDFVSFGLLPEYDTETDQNIRADISSCYNQKEVYNRILNDNSVAGYACNKLFRRSIIADDRFDETLMSCEDIDFCARITKKCKRVIHTDAKFYHYRQRSDSMTGDYNYNSRKLSVLTAYENIMPIFFEYDNDDYYMLEKNYLKIALNIKGRMIISKVKDKNVSNKLEEIISNNYSKVMNEPKNSLLVKLNIRFTKCFPSLLLRIKQLVLKNKRGF